MSVTFWLKLKMRSPEEKDSCVRGVVKRRSESKRQRRLLLRLATSVDTLLRLRFRLPLNPNCQHTFPVSPTEARQLLQLLASGVSVEALVATEGERCSNRQQEEETMSDVSSCKGL